MAFKKTAARKRTAQKKATKTSARTETKTKAKANPLGALISNKDRYHRIQEAAYLLAEKDGFLGDPSSYWLAAELKIRRQLEKA